MKDVEERIYSDFLETEEGQKLVDELEKSDSASEGKVDFKERPEPLVQVGFRIPYSVAEALKDLARSRSKAEGRRITQNDLATEALRKLLAG